MKMDRNLFLAILSMDSYNRGYGQGTTGLGVTVTRAITPKLCEPLHPRSISPPP
jgi:hypothetical protein